MTIFAAADGFTTADIIEIILLIVIAILLLTPFRRI